MRKMRLVVTVLAVVMLATGSVYANEQQKSHEGGEREKGKLFKELKLTPEQEKKLEDNRKAQQEQLSSLREALKTNHNKLQAKLKDPAVTRSAVEPLVSEIKSLQAKLVDNRIDGIFAVKSILTPEQFVKFDQIVEKQMKDRISAMKNSREKSKGPHPAIE
jgi:Spy/CpxP family protein refolding chaperone